MYDDNDVQEKVFWIMMFLAFMMLLFMGVVEVYGQTPSNNKDKILERNPVPHLNPGCSLTGGKDKVKCSCVSMVHEVQVYESRECWKKANPILETLPDNEIDKVIELMSPFPPKGVLDCLDAVPDHCSIISWGSWQYERRGYGSTDARRCGTECRPQLCKCHHDTVCKEHNNRMEDFRP